jgi:hypothetical protein
MMEDVQIMQLNIKHYQQLLTLDHYTPETRQRAKELLFETQARLRFAKSTSGPAKSTGILTEGRWAGLR